MGDDSRRRLIALYAELAALTEPECSHSCEPPLSCCAESYCLDAIEFARQSWNVELQQTSHPVLPLMGAHGCTVAPHLRPMCAAHTCDITRFGGKRGDPLWTERYFKLQDAIADLENGLALHRR